MSKADDVEYIRQLVNSKNREWQKFRQDYSIAYGYIIQLCNCLEEAEKEIKRLKAMYESAKGDLDDVIIGRDETIKQLQDEIERLRKENNGKESRKDLSA